MRWDAGAVILLLLAANATATVLKKLRSQTFLSRSLEQYSSHECQGKMDIMGDGPTEGVRNMTCRFQNLCYDMSAEGEEEEDDDSYGGDDDDAVIVRKKKRLMYFAQSGDAKEILQTFTSLDLRPMSQSDCNPAVKLPIDVVSGPVPAGAVMSPHAVTVLFQPFGSENFGHQVADDMFAVYVMQQLYHVANPYDSQLLTLDSCDRPEIDHANRARCKGMMAKLYPAISKHPVLQLQSSDLLKADRPTDANDEPSLMCFPVLIAGAGAHSFRSPTMEGQSDAYFAYRSFVLRNELPSCVNGTCDQLAPASGRKTILVAKKTEFNQVGMGSGIPNPEELQKHLSRAFPDHEVVVQDLALLSFHDQLALVARTSVMLSHSGGGSFSGLFLPPGATLAILSKEGTAKQPYWMNKELTFWRSLRWLTLVDVDQDFTPSVAEAIVSDALGVASQSSEQDADDDASG